MLNLSSRKSKRKNSLIVVLCTAILVVICAFVLSVLALFSGDSGYRFFSVKRMDKRASAPKAIVNIDEGFAAEFIKNNLSDKKNDDGEFPVIYPTGEWLNSNTGAGGEIRDHILKETAMMGDDYFKNTLFLGDSRMVGLSMAFKDSEATFYAGVGLSVNQLNTKKIIGVGSETEYTVMEAIENDGKTYDRIYMMFGLNELGWGYPSVFIKSLSTAVGQLKELCPEAQICIISIMPVSAGAKVSGVSDGEAANAKIREYNSLMLELAAELDLWYLDAHGLFADETGMLPSDISGDGIHLGSSSNRELIKFIASHAFAP